MICAVWRILVQTGRGLRVVGQTFLAADGVGVEELNWLWSAKEKSSDSSSMAMAEACASPASAVDKSVQPPRFALS